MLAGITCTLIPLLATICAFSVPDEIDPGSGFFTAIAMLPTWPEVAVPVAVSCVDETRVAVSVVFPKLIVAPFAKCAPVTVKLNVPTRIDVGAIDVICGTGLVSVTALLAVLLESEVATALTVIM